MAGCGLKRAPSRPLVKNIGSDSRQRSSPSSSWYRKTLLSPGSRAVPRPHQNPVQLVL
jgi:hypothetical protein